MTTAGDSLAVTGLEFQLESGDGGAVVAKILDVAFLAGLESLVWIFRSIPCRKAVIVERKLQTRSRIESVIDETCKRRRFDEMN